MRKLVNTLRYGSGDAEGVTWHSRRGKLDMLIWADSTDGKIYELKRGRDHRFGTRDDVMKRQFATTTPTGRRLTDPNGVYFDRKTGHLFTVSASKRFVLETTLAGAFVKTIDMPFCRMAQDPPVVASPTSCSLQAPTDRGGGPYLTDRGVDNDVNPAENDGRLYQVKLVDVP